MRPAAAIVPAAFFVANSSGWITPFEVYGKDHMPLHGDPVALASETEPHRQLLSAGQASN